MGESYGRIKRTLFSSKSGKIFLMLHKCADPEAWNKFTYRGAKKIMRDITKLKELEEVTHCASAFAEEEKDCSRNQYLKNKKGRHLPRPLLFDIRCPT